MQNTLMVNERDNANNVLLNASKKRGDLIVKIITTLLMFLFLYTSASKLVDLELFKEEMHNQPFPAWMASGLVWALPVIEILICVVLFFNRTRRLGLWISLVLMSLFTFYTGIVLFNVFDRIPCSCGGVIKNLTWTQHLFFNLFFVLISIWGLVLTRKRSQHVLS